MGKLESTIKQEMSRIARREARQLVRPIRAELARLKNRNAELTGTVDSLRRTLQEEREKARVAGALTKKAPVKGRLSPRLIALLRKKLGLSQAKFARLLGVSTLSVGNWELGKTKPRPALREKILSFRGLGRRDVKVLLGKA